VTSHRQKKKATADGVSKLRNKPGWDPSSPERESVEQQLEKLGQSERTEQAYSKEKTCSKCIEARQNTNDDTALCPAHYSELIGF